jgi:hypothetical protein
MFFSFTVLFFYILYTVSKKNKKNIKNTGYLFELFRLINDNLTQAASEKLQQSRSQTNTYYYEKGIKLVSITG